MVVIRNRIASLGAGGPRQFAEIQNIILTATEPDQKSDARSELDNVGFDTRELRNAPVVIARPRNTLEDVIENIQSEIEQARQAVSDIQEAREEEEGVIESTAATLRATRGLIEQVRQIGPIRTADFAHSFADFGPENLRMDPVSLRSVANPEEEKNNLGDVVEGLGLPDAWATTRGENVTVAIFDTGYAEDLISSSRVEATFSGEEVDSAFAPAEGHGTMCAGASAANSDEGVPFDGAAPDARVILARITDEEGQIRTDIISQAWDWLIDRSGGTPASPRASSRAGRRIVVNHSYGTPICSTARRPQFCNDALSDVIRIANSDANITSCYAAGNEAMYCGHRPSGITNGVTAHNSLEDVITVGALLSSGREAQRYSSHGRGDCAPRADPKPNVSSRIPEKTYYGVEDGWTIKDMSTGLFGSGGGTSHASPLMTGMIALVQSASEEPLQTEEIKQIIQEHSEPPRPTQINQFGVFAGPSGWDARFGFGEFNVKSAVEAVSS